MIETRPWHWFITIPIGACYRDDEVEEKLRFIDAHFCGKYLLNRYQRLPDDARFVTIAAFEGERRFGDRHAHALVYVPEPKKNCSSRESLIAAFPEEFQLLWNVLSFPNDGFRAWQTKFLLPLKFDPAEAAAKVYTVKYIQDGDLPWSRFVFITPPKAKSFRNENLSVMRNRSRQKLRALKKREADVQALFQNT